MKFFRPPVFTGFAPNATPQDVKLACQFLFFPWKWKNLRAGESVKKAEDWFKKYFSARHCFAFDSGRTSLFYALKALGAGEGDEVLVQGLTCVVVSNAVVWTGAKPIYVDVNDDLNMDPADLEKKITAKSKILIIQHTFGLPAKIDDLIAVARKHNLKIVEDCAHSLGATYHEKLVGTFGDLSIFSFGSNKLISCVRGGCVITNDDELGAKLAKFRSRLPPTRLLKIFQHLWHYPIFFIAKPLYNFGVGRLILYLAKHAHLIARVIYPPEKKGKQVLFYPALFPNSLAAILLNQLDDLAESNRRREKNAEKYIKDLEWKLPYQRGRAGRVWLYFTIFVNRPELLAAKFKKDGVLILGTDWTGAVIAPKDADQAAAGYKAGDCPNAERLCKQIVNLPTHHAVTLAKK